MKTLGLLLMLVLAAPALRAQSPDSAWNARLAALDAERDTEAGVSIWIIFDDSGSMNDNNKIGMAKQAFRAWVQKAPPSYRFGLVALNAGPLVKLRPNNKAEVLAAVDRLHAEGGTPLADVIARVGGEIRARRTAGAVYERQVVVILTDGEDTTARGDEGAQKEIKHLRSDRIEVLAFGYQGEGEYMKNAATHFFSPDNEDDIRRGLEVIGAELGDVSDIVMDVPTRSRMEHLFHSNMPASAPAVAAATPSPPEPEADATPEPGAGVHRSGHSGWVWVLSAVAVLFFLKVLRRR